jgi:hypothetical protein
MEMRQKAVQLPFVGAKVQSFEVPRDLGRFRLRRKYLARAAPRDGDDMALSWIGEDVVDPTLKTNDPACLPLRWTLVAHDDESA